MIGGRGALLGQLLLLSLTVGGCREPRRLLEPEPYAALSVPGEGYGAEDSVLCRHPGPGCETYVSVQLPLGPAFEIRRDPLGPLELRASLEFFANSSCWRTLVMTSADIRAGVPTSCVEAALGAINVGDGSRILIKEGSYYVRVRGIDGAPYSHFIWEQERGQPPRAMEITAIDAEYGASGSGL